MTALSINLPDFVANATIEAANLLGISRSAFIKQAVIHELNLIDAKIKQESIAFAFKNLAKSKAYMTEAVEIMDFLNSDLPDEKDEWWSKK